MHGLPADPGAFQGEPEGAAVPGGLEVTDAHVHLFPPRLFAAIWRWFDRHAWSIRYRLNAEEVVAFLRGRGVRRIVALHYAHVPGLARELNRFAAEAGRAHPDVVPLATVLPGEPDAPAILREALGPLGLRGVKIHCHVQKIAADDPRLEPVWTACEAALVPAVVHAGREPSSPAYGLDTRALCSADQIDRVLAAHPRLTLIVPHLGADEFDAYRALLERHENLWLDTTMAVSGYFTAGPAPSLFPALAGRMLYGTDFPNIPYAWDRELRRIAAAGLPEADLRALLWGNAAKLFPT